LPTLFFRGTSLANPELSGKVAFITGSSRGIGKAIAIKLAEMGAKIAINDLPGNPEASITCQYLISQGAESILALADVTDSSAIKAAVSGVIDKWGKIDILVNNAGILKNNLLLRTSEEDWDAVISTNLNGAYIVTRQVLRNMLGQVQGRVINIASVAGMMGNMGAVSYSSSKGGLIAFTRSLAAEVGSRNITVNAIAPGFIETSMSGDVPVDARNVLMSRTALKRTGKPQDIAELAAFLASDRASYITGQVICIDGGIT
jgi:3-oxoacyl-[acyl-carrier protein] reductase